MGDVTTIGLDINDKIVLRREQAHAAPAAGTDAIVPVSSMSHLPAARTRDGYAQMTSR
jgi:hypothetical protein